MTDSLDAKRTEAVEVLLDRLIRDAENPSVAGEELDGIASAYASASEELEYARGEGRSNPRL